MAENKSQFLTDAIPLMYYLTRSSAYQEYDLLTTGNIMAESK